MLHDIEIVMQRDLLAVGSEECRLLRNLVSWIAMMILGERSDFSKWKNSSRVTIYLCFIFRKMSVNALVKFQSNIVYQTNRCNEKSVFQRRWTVMKTCTLRILNRKQSFKVLDTLHFHTALNSNLFHRKLILDFSFVTRTRWKIREKKRTWISSALTWFRSREK